MSSPTNDTSTDVSPERKQPSSTRLDQVSLGQHTKRAQGDHPPNVTKKLYINSWVASQTTENERRDSDIPAPETPTVEVPLIVLTDTDQEETEPTKLPAEKPSSSSAVQKRKVNTRRRSLDVASGSGYQRTSPGARRKTMTVIDQPILEEPEDAGILNEEDTGHHLNTVRSVAVKLTVPTTMVDTSSSVAQEPSVSRHRAKSYPAYSHEAAQPLLELPHRSERSQLDIQQAGQSSTGVDANVKTDKLTKFAQVAFMAKKWKKRSDSYGDASTENNKESVAIRQKKRPYIEVPRALKLDILEDAYPIVQKTYQMYKSYLGNKHKLTVLAEQHMDSLNVQLGKSGNT